MDSTFRFFSVPSVTKKDTVPDIFIFAGLFQAMSGFGYEIVHTLIVDIEPDPKVKTAMNEINAGKYTF